MTPAKIAIVRVPSPITLGRCLRSLRKAAVVGGIARGVGHGHQKILKGKRTRGRPAQSPGAEQPGPRLVVSKELARLTQNNPIVSIRIELHLVLNREGG